MRLRRLFKSNMELQKSFVLVAVLFVATTEARHVIPQGRIFGGHEAMEGQFPYHVLVTQAIGDGKIIVCGGAIISTNYVVTAGHCVNGSLSSTISVSAGSIEFSSGGVVVPVAEFELHPKYAQYDYDIALLRLNTSLKLNDKIKPIPLASTAVPEGSQVLVTGFGGIEDGGISDRLLYVAEEALNHDTCIERLNILADSMRCLAKDAGNGICGGDSGGPAAYNGVLIGVASFGVNGCASELPNGFTDILAARDWICKVTHGDHIC